MNRDFQFKIDLDFCSLQEFKETIVKYSIMNGRKVVCRPNDKVRARAKCKDKCGYEIFYSKVGKSSTYRIKTVDQNIIVEGILATRMLTLNGCQKLLQRS